MTAEGSYGRGVPLVADTSAWARRHHPAIVERWRATVAVDLLASCPVVALELLTVMRSGGEYDDFDRALRALRQAPVTATVCAAALSASRPLVLDSSVRRIPAADHLIAAAAAERSFDVLHYDSDYDTLAEHLGFESVWIAPSGSIP